MMDTQNFHLWEIEMRRSGHLLACGVHYVELDDPALNDMPETMTPIFEAEYAAQNPGLSVKLTYKGVMPL